jgi:surface antigen
MKYVSVLALLSLLLLASCANRGQTGAVGGAAAGALIGQAIGHNTEGTLIGAAVGTMLGYIVGSEMDKYDRQQLDHMYERGVSNQRSTWVNPDTGNQYTVTPQPAYQEPSSRRVCRRAEIEAIIDGRPQRIRPVGIAAALIRSISGDHAGR